MMQPTAPIALISEERGIEFGAMQQFVLRCTIPIMVEVEENRPVPRGTGTLFRIDDRHFIVTARHLMEQNASELEHLAVPESLTGTRFIRILNAVYTIPTVDYVDVAVIEITNSDSIAGIKEHWDFLTLDNVKVTAPTSPVWVVGYPETQYTLQGTTMTFEPATVLTELLPNVPSGAKLPIYPGLDFFFLYEKTAVVLGKGPRTTPKMPGVSGASIWELVSEPPPGELWVPKRFFRAVAIQSSYIHSQFLRAQSWWAVARSLAKIDERLREAIFDRTGVTPDSPP